MANQVKHRTTAAVIALLLTTLLVAFELRLNRSVVVDFGKYTSVYSSKQVSQTSSSIIANNTTTVNHIASCPIGDDVINEYDKWHTLVWNLSNIRLRSANWTPVIYDWKNHPAKRNDRFPSIAERIRYYMGKWYDKSIPMYGKEFQADAYIQRKSTREYGPYSNILVDFTNKDNLWNCYNSKKEYKVFSPYCRDYMDIAILHSQRSANILQYIGDGVPHVTHEIRKYPIFGKVRPLIPYDDNTTMAAVRPIILPLNRKRHYGITSDVSNNDVPWEQKVSKAIWRGKYDTPRTRHIAYSLVSKYVNSTLVNAKFSKHTTGAPHDMVGEYKTMKEQLIYKYIVSIEGNDVSSGLKWMLLSNSVVLTPPFTVESWAMEGSLKPYVHYLPLKSDMSNVEDMIQWAEMHPKETRLISERSTLYIYDMFYHPDAIEDERQVMIGIMERYEHNFGYDEEMRKRQSYFMTPQLDHGYPLERAKQRLSPSIDERVKFLMGKWYHNIDALSMHRSNIRQIITASHTILLHNNVSSDCLFIASGQLLSACAMDDNNQYPTDIRLMCQSSLQHFDERNTADLKSNSFNRLLQSKAGRKIKLGPVSSWNKDNTTTMNKESKRVILDDTIKILCYARSCITHDDNHVPYFANYRHSNDAILWPFSDHHSDYFIDLLKHNDINFENKIPRSSSDELTYNNESSDRIYHIRDRLQYRYLVAAREGTVNDDLVWMLLSQSVVFMSDTRQQGALTSWMMESFLEPYVHYIPIASDYADVDEKVAWCENNLDKVEIISQRATVFVHNLLFAEKENEEVKFQVMERYSKIFG